MGVIIIRPVLRVSTTIPRQRHIVAFLSGLVCRHTLQVSTIITRPVHWVYILVVVATRDHLRIRRTMRASRRPVSSTRRRLRQPDTRPPLTRLLRAQIANNKTKHRPIRMAMPRRWPWPPSRTFGSRRPLLPTVRPIRSYVLPPVRPRARGSVPTAASWAAIRHRVPATTAPRGP